MARLYLYFSRARAQLTSVATATKFAWFIVVYPNLQIRVWGEVRQSVIGQMREEEFVEGVTADVQHNGKKCVVYYAAMHPGWNGARWTLCASEPFLGSHPWQIWNNSVLARVLVRFFKNMHVPQSNRRGSLMQQPPKLPTDLGWLLPCHDSRRARWDCKTNPWHPCVMTGSVPVLTLINPEA